MPADDAAAPTIFFFVPTHDDGDGDDDGEAPKSTDDEIYKIPKARQIFLSLTPFLS